MICVKLHFSWLLWSEISRSININLTASPVATFVSLMAAAWRIPNIFAISGKLFISFNKNKSNNFYIIERHKYRRRVKLKHQVTELNNALVTFLHLLYLRFFITISKMLSIFYAVASERETDVIGHRQTNLILIGLKSMFTHCQLHQQRVVDSRFRKKNDLTNKY